MDLEIVALVEKKTVLIMHNLRESLGKDDEGGGRSKQEAR
jgi:hypothetical protein